MHVSPHCLRAAAVLAKAHGDASAEDAPANSAQFPEDSPVASSHATIAAKRLKTEPKKKPKDLLSLVKSLQQQCLVRQEEWWTYELCFNAGIRQFHLQVDVVQAAGANKGGRGGGAPQIHMSVQAEFMLGNAPVATYRSLAGMTAAVTGGYRSNSRNETTVDSEGGVVTVVLQR